MPGIKISRIGAGIVLNAEPEVIGRAVCFARVCTMAKYYVGVDPSILNTGIVVLDDSGNICDAFNGKPYIKSQNGFSRYMQQANGIHKRLSKLKGNFSCGYEDYSFGSTHWAYDLSEFGGLLKAAIVDLKPQKICLVSPSVNKKFAIGFGGAEKEEMQAQLYTEAGLKETSTDIADAYFLALFAAYNNKAYIGKEPKLTRLRIELALKNKKQLVFGK